MIGGPYGDTRFVHTSVPVKKRPKLIQHDANHGILHPTQVRGLYDGVPKLVRIVALGNWKVATTLGGPPTSGVIPHPRDLAKLRHFSKPPSVVTTGGASIPPPSHKPLEHLTKLIVNDPPHGLDMLSLVGQGLCKRGRARQRGHWFLGNALNGYRTLGDWGINATLW